MTCNICKHYYNYWCSLSDVRVECPIDQCCDEFKKNYSEKVNPFTESQCGGNHYRKGDTMDVAEWCERRQHSPCEMNVIKYVDRHKDKGGIEDLRKAYQYLKFLAWVCYEDNL